MAYSGNRLLRTRTSVQFRTKAMQEKFLALNKNDEAMLRITKLLAQYTEPYVPYNTGELTNSTKVTPRQITYSAKGADGRGYARYMYRGIVYGPNFFVTDKKTGEIIGWRSYHGEEKHPIGRSIVYGAETYVIGGMEIPYGNNVHPKATKEWDKAMLSGPDGSAFRKKAGRIVSEEYKKMYG